MIAIPAIDLSDSYTSRASLSMRWGDHDASNQPALSARALADMGFGRIHLVGFTKEASVDANTPAIEAIVRDTDARIQVVGRSSRSEMEQLFRVGAEYVVVGDRSIDEPEWLAEVADSYPGAVVAQTDIRDRRVVRRGWVRTLPIDVVDLIEDLNGLPLGGILVSGIQLDGPTRHADLALVEDLAERSQSPMMVWAKADSMNDLRALDHRGAAAVVLPAGCLLSGALDPRSVSREFGNV